MASQSRARRKRRPYHPAPVLEAALEFFKSVGMGGDAKVNFWGGVAEFVAASGTRFRKRVPEANWNCQLVGVQLLAMVKPLNSQASFVVGAEQLTITTETDRFEMKAEPGYEPEPVTWIRPLAPDMADVMTDLATLANAHKSNMMLTDGCLCLNAQGQLVAQARAFSCPDRILRASEVLKLKKIKAPLFGMGHCSERQLVFFFGSSPDANDAVLVITGDNPDGASWNGAIFDHWPRVCAVELPPSFFRTIKHLGGLSADGLVHFRQGAACVKGENEVIAERQLDVGFPIPDAAYSIKSLLAVEAFAEHVEFGFALNVPCVWFHDETTRGALAAVEVGTVDDKPPVYDLSEANAWDPNGALGSLMGEGEDGDEEPPF